MAQQTAVEWLENKIDDLLELYPSEREKVNEVIEQAKQMEKEQIIAACNQTDVIGLDNEQPGDQYYNKTYGK